MPYYLSWVFKGARNKVILKPVHFEKRADFLRIISELFLTI